MNETDIEPSVDNSIVVANEESPKIIFKVESNEKSDVVSFFSKQDGSITDIVFEVKVQTVKQHIFMSIAQLLGL